MKRILQSIPQYLSRTPSWIQRLLDLLQREFAMEQPLQIGVGRVPDAIGPLLRDHRNLGVHTELFSQSLMELMKAGVINNSKKTLLPGKAVFSFAGGQLDFVHGARWSKGGKSFIVINSTTEGKDGNRLSKIDVALPLGSAVTTPEQMWTALLQSTASQSFALRACQNARTH